ncbi:ankyrin repeat-containing domain protein [Echria macrotheca]|uniref:Ankyrin repeat-containing domain protein n=1 Tax=Echria macrotheca TaxID=438768 RepID=A0AAJ0F6A5_9PEZI|nr:ankyrin repeat-containing domain protein [Echria macrotheca]
MRLINTSTHLLESFIDDETPMYAILSHRWGPDEVTFIDMQALEWETVRSRQGYAKFASACDTAKHYGFHYIWIDTCCIDKSSSAELSEAINSMYRWYQDAAICFAYLEDVKSLMFLEDVPKPIRSEEERASYADQLPFSEWFKRGWTLQELIAPRVLIFLDHDWHRIGSKHELVSHLSSITKINAAILTGSLSVDSASVAERMSWAAERKTTRGEDMAYCLMGLFGINMPMLYGEGQKAAFHRLQEEIIKVSDDHSIFAWSCQDVGTNQSTSSGILAPSPAAFNPGFSAGLIPSSFANGTPSGAIKVDSKGVHITLRFPADHLDGRSPIFGILPCASLAPNFKVGIWLVPLAEPGVYRHYGYDTDHHMVVVVKGEEDDNKYRNETVCVQRNRERDRPNIVPAITKAARTGNTELVQLMLASGAEANDGADRGLGPLTDAARRGHAAVVDLLLRNGATVNYFDGSKTGEFIEPLQLAVRYGHADVVQRLLLAGADVNHKGAANKTCLHVAVDYRHADIVAILLENGANIDEVDEWGRTALSMAARDDNAAVLKVLIEKGANLEIGDTKSGRTALGWAVSHGAKAAVEILLDAGADIQIDSDRSSKTELLARQFRRRKVAEMLAERRRRLVLHRGTRGIRCV